MEPIKEEPRLKKEMYERTFGYVSGGLGVVAGLAWNEAISELIKVAVPIERNSLTIRFLYAIIITLVIVLVIRYLHKIIERLEK